MNCEVVRAEAKTMLAIPVGAYTFNKPCRNKAAYRITPKPGSAFNKKSMRMCASCKDECVRELGNTVVVKKL